VLAVSASGLGHATTLFIATVTAELDAVAADLTVVLSAAASVQDLVVMARCPGELSDGWQASNPTPSTITRVVVYLRVLLAPVDGIRLEGDTGSCSYTGSLDAAAGSACQADGVTGAQRSNCCRRTPIRRCLRRCPAQ
jgi:hypothetical protein